MRFDEWYLSCMKPGIVQRECECIGCREATFWRYDYPTKYERIFLLSVLVNVFTEFLNREFATQRETYYKL